MKATRMHSVLRKGGSLFASLFLVFTVEALMPHTSQHISLRPGWNAIYLEVGPEQTPDVLFASWPVTHVGLYDPASFLATRQFSAEWNSQGMSSGAMSVWYRGVPEASSLKSVPPGSVLVTFNTNATDFAATLYGGPAAPRTTWHVTGTNTVYNFVGFSVSQETDIAAYLEGSPCESVKSRAYYRITGDDPNAAPGAREVRTTARTVKDGDVLLLPSDTISDWSGVLHISPLNGIDFGQNSSSGALAIRNDGTASRRVRLEFVSPHNAAALYRTDAMPNYVYVRDPDVSGDREDWQSFYAWDTWEPVAAGLAVGYGKALYKTLAPGETWNLQFGLDRRELQREDRLKGQPFGMLVNVSEDSAAHAKAVIPIYGETSGEPPDEWDCGLWVADVEFNSVRMVDLKRYIETNEVDGVQVVTTNVVETSLSDATKAGGTFKVRLPVHRDREGRLRLLQRVVVAGEVTADGTYNYSLYAGEAKPPTSGKTLMRISSVCLPTETPVIEASEENLRDYHVEGTRTATFDFTVGAYGATSLLRHPYHPQHDGLRWDFATRAPDGDDVYNYMSDVKPETFSVQNEIKLMYSLGVGVEQWSPEYEFNGTCKWTLSGLRHDGVIVLNGPMVIRRISPNARLILK